MSLSVPTRRSGWPLASRSSRARSSTQRRPPGPAAKRNSTMKSPSFCSACSVVASSMRASSGCRQSTTAATCSLPPFGDAATNPRMANASALHHRKLSSNGHSHTPMRPADRARARRRSLLQRARSSARRSVMSRLMQKIRRPLPCSTRWMWVSTRRCVPSARRQCDSKVAKAGSLRASTSLARSCGKSMSHCHSHNCSAASGVQPSKREKPALASSTRPWSSST